MPLILQEADLVTICRIGLPQQLAVLHCDLCGCTFAHFILCKHGHSNLDAVLSYLQGLLHLIENWLLTRNSTLLSVMRLQIFKN